MSIHSRTTALPTDDSSRKRTSSSPVTSGAAMPVRSASCFLSCGSWGPSRSHSTKASCSSAGSSASVSPRWCLCRRRVSHTRFSAKPMRPVRAARAAARPGEGAARCTVSTSDQACATSCGTRSTSGQSGGATSASASGVPAGASEAPTDWTLCAATWRASETSAARCKASRTESPSWPPSMKAGMGGAGEPKSPMRKAGREGPSSGRSLTTTAALAPASAQSQTAAAQSGVAGLRWIMERSSRITTSSLPPDS
mmetsp:Transcript_58599/g.171951  ORF Transcript_58599/g.171951 Transcript_58599/m.171951 type:complete len:254 (+) Transcript_58599:1398-2159(+)